MRRLIIGLDTTPQGEDAVALGRLLCEALELRPVLTTALPIATNVLSAADIKAVLEEDTELVFAKALEQLDAIDAETYAVAARSPGAVLSGMAETDDVLVIVVGSSRRGPLGRILAGSVGQNLLHGASCAVAVAPRGFAERKYRRLHRLGVAFDGSGEGWVALRTAIRLAERLHATLHVISVFQPPGATGTGFAGISAGEYYASAHKAHAKMLEEGIASVPKDLPVVSQLSEGEPGEIICEAGRDLDLMIIGSRGYGPVKRTFLGSTSSRVIRGSECPVLVLPRAAGDDPLRLGGSGAEAVVEQATSKV